MKKCSGCKKEYPKTTEYFHKNKLYKDGFHYWCKSCANKYYREYKVKKSRKREIKEKKCYYCKKVYPNTQSYFYRLKNKPKCINCRTKEFYKNKKKKEKAKEREKKKVKYYKTKTYKIENRTSSSKGVIINPFIGKIIQETDDLIVLQSKKGIIESFRKNDLELGFYKVKVS